MALVNGRMWECNRCGWRWIYVEGRMSKQCPNPKCRSRRWNHAVDGPKVEAASTLKPKTDWDSVYGKTKKGSQ